MYAAHERINVMCMLHMNMYMWCVCCTWTCTCDVYAAHEHVHEVSQPLRWMMSDVWRHDKNVLETALQDVNLVLILSHRQYTSILNYDSGLVLYIYILVTHQEQFSFSVSAPFQTPALPLLTLLWITFCWLLFACLRISGKHQQGNTLID